MIRQVIHLGPCVFHWVVTSPLVRSFTYKSQAISMKKGSVNDTSGHSPWSLCFSLGGDFTTNCFSDYELSVKCCHVVVVKIG
jgi:hypothetical protein